MASSKLSPFLAGALVLILSAASSPVRANDGSPYPEEPSQRTLHGPAVSRPSGGGGSESWVPQSTHFFLAGGFGDVGVTLPLGLALGGWSVTAGLELPVARTWSLVPRLHASNTSGQSDGNVLWARLALDGRISSQSGGIITYREAGLGFGLLDTPIRVMDAGFESHLERRTFGQSFFQIITGLKGDPDLAPAFMIEVVLALGQGAEQPIGLELVAGIEF